MTVAVSPFKDLFGVRDDGLTEWTEPLTDIEYDAAIRYGVKLWRRSQELGFADKVSDPEKSRRMQELQMLTELAVAKYLGLAWNHEGFSFKNADLAHNIEVRTIGVEYYALRVYPNDRDHMRVVGVVCPKGKERDPYALPGWIGATEARNIGILIDPNGRGQPFYAIPQKSLRPMRELREIIRQENLEFEL